MSLCKRTAIQIGRPTHLKEVDRGGILFADKQINNMRCILTYKI